MTKVPDIAKALSAVELLIQKQGADEEVGLHYRPSRLHQLVTCPHAVRGLCPPQTMSVPQLSGL